MAPSELGRGFGEGHPFRRPIGVMYRRRRELPAAARAVLALLTTELGVRS